MTLNSIIANFQTFKLADLLDIVIIAFLIYQLLGIINRTRAGQLAKGALLVLEWPEYLAPGLREENRLDIELRPVSGGGQGENLDIPGQSCEMKRSAVITAHGAAGAALLEALRPVLSSRFAVRGA